MPRSVATTQLYAFSAPVVKGTDLVQPVLVGAGHPHGLRATVAQWRAAAVKILEATEPAALHRAHISAARGPLNLSEAAAAGAPLPKPGGRVL